VFDRDGAEVPVAGVSGRATGMESDGTVPDDGGGLLPIAGVASPSGFTTVSRRSMGGSGSVSSGSPLPSGTSGEAPEADPDRAVVSASSGA